MKNLLLIFLMLNTLFTFGCSTSTIKDVKNPDYVGKTVTIYGTVQNTIKIGDVSGFSIKDATDTIIVSSEDLPKEGDNIRVRGILMKDTLLGYYIKAK